MKRAAVLLLAVVLPLSAALSSLAAQDKGKMKGYITRLPVQTVEIAGAAERFATAEKPCMNYAWAAAVVSLLREQRLRMKQEFFVMKSEGGAVCLERVTDFPLRAAVVSGDYTLEDGKRVRLLAEWVPGAPLYPDALIVALREGRPLMMVWKGKPYLLYGVVFDEHVLHTGARIFYMNELWLVDPSVAPGQPGRTVKFLRDKDDPDDIGGVMTLTARERGLYELNR